MPEKIYSAIENGKSWGLQIVVLITLIGTIYSSLFKTEDEARDYYTILHPAVKDALLISEDAETLARQNALQIANLKGLIKGINQCGANSAAKSKSTVLKNSKQEKRVVEELEDQDVMPAPYKEPFADKKSKTNSKHHRLPSRPWKQQMYLE